MATLFKHRKDDSANKLIEIVKELENRDISSTIRLDDKAEHLTELEPRIADIWSKDVEKTK